MLEVKGEIVLTVLSEMINEQSLVLIGLEYQLI